MATVVSVQKLIKAVQKQHETLLEYLERNRNLSQKFIELTTDLGWPPPGHLPGRIIDQIAQGYSEDNWDKSDIEGLLVNFHNEETIKGFEERWANYSWLSVRQPILHEAVESHCAGRYFSAICTLLPQVEGVFGDYLGRKPNIQNDASKVLSGTKFEDAISKFYKDYIYEGDKRNKHSLVGLSRHAILHGRDTTYGTLKNSIKIFIIADTVFSSLEEVRAC